MSKPKVLLDTNILISGVVFFGNEHKMLKLAEDKEIIIVLPEFVVHEAEQIIRERFGGYEALLAILLSNIGYIRVKWGEFDALIPLCKSRIRDRKDAPFLAALIVTKPEYAITGDRKLREDLSVCIEASGTKICTSRQFLEEFRKRL